jgi:hypothetical protein
MRISFDRLWRIACRKLANALTKELRFFSSNIEQTIVEDKLF